MGQCRRQGQRVSRRAACLLPLLACLPGAALAQDLQWHGYLDARLQWTEGADESWTQGGLGKARFGEGEVPASLSGALSATWQLSPALLAVVDLQAHPDTSPELGVLAAYLRFRPVSTGRWRWSVRAGAYFPPISLENDGIGWTSRWTLTPSAINSWVGEELRTIGAEARIEHRGEHGTIDFGVSVFRNNDPAGELLATRGWGLGDVTSVLQSRVRQPDVHAPRARSTAPLFFEPFVENDGRIGWHADLTWRSPSGSRVSLIRYDNRADPESFGFVGARKVFSWHTRFWSAGAEVLLGDVVLIAQAMDGSTAFEPVPERYLDTRFRAQFLLVAWNRGNWRPALRFDRFRARELPGSITAPLEENGHAWTAAMNWRPRPWLRVTGEWLRVDSHRKQRTLDGLSSRQREQQVQLNLRLLF